MTANGVTTNYTYDGNNLRQSKTTNGITTQHIWDGSNMVMDGTNKFYRGATGLEFATLNGNTSFYHKDAHGDVTALTDNTGTITQSYIYDAFGNQMNENENDINPFRYCSEYLDDETGLTYLRNRYCDNSIGRFTSEDTHWNVDNMIYGDKVYRDGEVKTPDINAIMQSGNLYAYCMNNPMKFVDPSGESAAATIGGAVLICSANGLITGGIYAWNGEPFWAGFINGFVSCLGTELGAVIGASAGPGEVYAGIIIGNTVGSAAASLVEDIMYHPEKSATELAKSAAGSAAWGVMAGVSSSYWKYAVKLANEAGSAAQTLMKYDEKFGEVLKVFFDQLANVLSSQ